MAEQVTTLDPQALSWRRTSPVAIVFFFGKVLRTAIDAGLAGIAAIWGAIQAGKSVWIIPGLLLLTALLALYSAASWLRFRYRLDDDKILLRRGVLHRDQLTVEFDKVQNVRVLEPFYARPFGLALLEIDTAGSSRQEITLGGIDADLAKRLRDRIVARQRLNDSIENSDSPTPADSIESAEPRLTRNFQEIALYGLTYNGLFWVAIILGALLSQMEDSAWLSYLRYFTDWTMIKVVTAVALGLLMLPLLSVFGALWRHYGYTLTRDGETWRRHSGLLSKHDETIKQHKIQALTWTQNFVARGLGRINLRLRTAKAGAAENPGQPGRKLPFLIPALLPLEAEEVTADLLPGSSVLDRPLSRVDRGQYIKKFLLLGWSWPLLGLHLILWHPIGFWSIALLPVSLAVATTILYQLWRRRGYGIHGEHGLYRTGFVGTRTTVFPLFKVQRIDLRQSPSQRRRGLAHLTVHLASHSMTTPYMRWEDALRFRDTALYHMETDPRPWF